MESFALAVGRESLFLVLILSAPPVLAAMAVGLLVSLLQATTQVQEQTLTFVPKLVAVITVVAFVGPIGMAQLITYTKTLFEAFPEYMK
ncbi:MAG: EscS/YscS/HrcS family type III secretion system export apparatus protein [Deltaproteobacteria bacterium RIFCSPLOWO2_12_FULL_40_28]|nr:MAG: EscS/YscS/HrcS family type III secretion system export apparatus protein [Deltaproteobacteria bacterium RIFCSPHIGHO2_02_FULL_40_28]OGQ18815.1 MAG: EscS/YscS/HrcS family type III secretion system export apparatus protein [Deltaproteobacteria bacterium RIFCSPHIGHO2_12_FULL_40_32]OGQ40060.1 MAG: EscS/YscS/HrcS family type III secretion system export apparatus protein [Deltaproteobacteria bacterium RIFCSPLOWO2_02_FULL_40_36]OGQ53243.1 MAG: EscS/YscS/HrcS family type III secretion system expo